MFEDFTYATYRQLLNLFLQTHRNLTCIDLPVSEATSPYFVLRHDIDYSPKAALRMAEFEASFGIRATYFLLLSTPYYNLLSEDYCALPKQLVELGHDVGFHYDVAALSRSGGADLGAALRPQIAVLEQLAGVPVRAIAMHNPSVSGEDPFRGYREFVNVYDDICVKEGKYFSDSCGAWRPETLSMFESGRLPARFQFLIHPIFWGEQYLDQWTRLDIVAEEIVADLKTRIVAQKDMWLRHPAVRSQAQRQKGQ
jgi:hypothetical protein